MLMTSFLFRGFNFTTACAMIRSIMKTKTVFPFVLILFTLFFSSCRMEQTIELDRTGGGEFSFYSQNAAFFEQTLEDAALFSGYSGAKELIENEVNNAEINLGQNPEVTDCQFESDKTYINGQVSIRNFFDFFSYYATENNSLIFNDTLTDMTRTISLDLTRETFQNLLPLVPLLNNPAFAAFTPAGTEGLSEKSYLDDLAFSFGPDNLSFFNDYSFELTLKSEQAVHEYTHSRAIKSEQIDKNTIRFSLSLIRLMLMDEELQIKIDLEK